MTPADFIAKWKDNSLSERAGAQAHFLDLCDLLGVDKPSDPDNYCFERGAKKTGSLSGNTGWADVWKRHCFAWEYKGPDANLGPALKQLMTYALALDNPPLLVVSDRKRIEIHTHFTGTPSEVWTIAIEDIATPENLQRLRWLFTDPDQFKPQRTRTAITLQAAKLIGDLAWDMQQRNHDPHQVAHFLNKIIFCLFAEDAKGPASEPLLPNRLFSKVLETGLKDVERFQRQLKNLFGAMANRHGEFGEHLIQWFNGGLFDDDLTLPLTRDDLEKLTNVGLLDWSAIEPSIFGTLFERGLDPAKRSQLGAHYTDPVSIMRIVNPVIVEPLLAEWVEEKAHIASQMAVLYELESSKKSADKAKATNALKDATRRYIAFKERLKNFKVLDPACGSGNFLYLALQSLKDIELRVDLEAESLGLQRGFPEVGPQAMHGIELSPYAAELARVTVWIGDIQWMLKHGFAPSREPILKTLDGIQCRDALLVIDDGGEKDSGAFIGEADWPNVDVIIGNPPFLGGSKMREELGPEYTVTLRAEYAGRVPGGADLVCYWFAKAQEAISTGNAQRAGLVATNSIRQPTNRPVVEKITATGQIYNAWSDEEWVNEGAAVRVSIVCFTTVRPEPVEGPGR
ncbi:MAG: class I SAM-dependent DNA methyltransferase, partial [Betaproteobacteria bacterium]|nr:class I SAM-dependent DNA methyltransferase [Betaproteobacteria bacterium]